MTDFVYDFHQGSRDMADLLVGVVGDFVPAREVLRPGYLLSLMLAPAAKA